MTRKNHKKVYATPCFIKHFLILSSTVAGFASISVFASLVSNPIGITSSAVGFKICLIAAAIKKYKLIIKKRKRSMIRVLSTKSKLNNIEVLISKDLIDSVTRHDEFVLINNILKEHNKWKKK